MDGEAFNPKDFTLLFLFTDSVTCVTKLNRVNHRRVLVFIGNGDGVIAYAKGKGLDYGSAFSNAYMQLKQNLIVIDIDHMLTLGSSLKSKFYDYRLWIYPRSNPNYWGSMQIYHMLMLTGIWHCRFVVKSRKRNPYALVYAYMMAITQAKKPSVFAELTGQKFATVTYNSMYGQSVPMLGQSRYKMKTYPR